MLITIIIPTYNRASIIIKTLESIRKQSFKDWTCIIVDDHSSDNTQIVVTDYIQNDSRFRYLVNTHKKGAQGARNTGLYYSNTDWVFFFDSDNQMHPDCLKELSAAITNDVDIIQCFSVVLSIKSGEKKRVFNWKNYGHIHDVLLDGQTYVDFNHAIIRRSKVIDIGGLDENCPCMQEYDTHLRLSNIANYTTVEKFLVDYFVGSEDAISTSTTRDIVGKIYILKKYLSELNLRRKRLKYYVFYLVTLIQNNNDVQFKKVAYGDLKALVPGWYITRGKVLSYLLVVRNYLFHRH